MRLVSNQMLLSKHTLSSRVDAHQFSGFIKTGLISSSVNRLHDVDTKLNIKLMFDLKLMVHFDEKLRVWK